MIKSLLFEFLLFEFYYLNILLFAQYLFSTENVYLHLETFVMLDKLSENSFRSGQR